MEDLVRESAERGSTIGLIGGRNGLAVKAFERLRHTYPKLVGWGSDTPEFSDTGLADHAVEYESYFTELAKKLRQTHTSILFIGLGAPKQEYFAQSLARAYVNSGDVRPLVLMSVGGSFGLIADTLKRAPLLIRLMGFEWAWRLGQEPWRWKRQLALLKFIWLVFTRRDTA